MKNVTVKALLAIGVMAAATSASAVQVFLYEVGQRAGSGTYYESWFDGGDGGLASTATWDWNSGTGVLTQTGGFLRANQRLMGADGAMKSPVGASILSDDVTGLLITATPTGVGGSTTATTYMCVEGTFNAGTGSHACANTAFGFNFANDSSVAYNVNGNASCEERTVGGDDSPGAGGIYRGLRSWNGTGNALCGGATVDGDNTGRGSLDVIQIITDTIGIGGELRLANWNNAGTVTAACYLPTASNPGCGRAHWLVFAVPVPAAVWLFGSALGLLGWVRRRAAA